MHAGSHALPLHPGAQIAAEARIWLGRVRDLNPPLPMVEAEKERPGAWRRAFPVSGALGGGIAEVANHDAERGESRTLLQICAGKRLEIEFMAPFKMQERDVDLFILEELHADSGFADWLAARIGIEGATFSDAAHSVSAKANAKWGETDVLAYFDKAGARIAVLIEDKISARFADAQCDRYHERANELLGEGLAVEYKLVLIAPDTYLSSVPKSDTWHCQLAIDDIASWFAQKNGSHANWRASALQSCLENVSKIMSAPKIEVKNFSEEFSNFLRSNAPEFSHDPTGDAYGLSVKWVNRPTGFSIFWKVSQDLVDLEMMGDHRSRIGTLKDKVGLVDRSKASTGMLGIPVKTASWGQPLSEQLDVVNEVVAACQRLRLVALELAAMP
ncbi:hypothetical protein GCM10007301_26450 [Azorhizobium oxalatiphilum]|uniref:PD-(D/E)XK nuclease superfamily protein n=1 Tax=Azorhizobium oxalatiphilum TaxID=980631 RepID=A0A917C2B4_9HYPH|nr:PD-(D/E)XK nuclease family protein [Azorhizobium oxalatiphilum]GGF65415.1 hypothetical protein GCM10007301_26450 [Azorhizobium oxalatiphilum]